MAGEAFTGPVPPGWEATTLGKIVERGAGHIQTGPFGSQLHASDYVRVGIPSIMPVNIGENRIVEEGIARISEADAGRLSRHRVRAGDIVYSRRGDVERRALVRPEQEGWLCGTGCLSVRLGEAGVDARFASYYLDHPEVRAWIVRHAVGATMPNLNTSIMQAVPFLVPPIKEQQAIAHILGSLDDKIELNRRMNRTLEALARAIFQAWFVDFEPVKAKAAGATRFPGMPQDVFDQLPREFADSEAGPVPGGWKVGSLGDYCEINGQSVRQGDLAGEIEYVDISSVSVGRLDSVTPVDAAQAPSQARRRARHGDTIWSCVRPNRQSYLFVHSPPANRLVSTGFAVLTPTEFGPAFLYQLVTRPEFVDYLVANADGSAYPAVRADHFGVARVLVPPREVRKAFDDLAIPLRDQIAHGEAESRTLAAVRDALLPKLLSGEIRVKNAERCAEGAA